ncbi:MAG: hypothetical protein F4029_07800 [Gammaproteobacteria bacterium]|nr:hypothetical protein [Gammaproteobacteria bacterium]MYF27581.1 hypothetical protein [Gammaproteobacteria bacterium]MYK46117.1 hypothetical protein [Gammaproteobacteria bacterium]
MNEPPWLSDALARVRRIGARLPHALLIHGPRGWGEERIANALALDLMALEPGRDARAVAHPDLRWLQPEDGVIRVDSIRAIEEFLVQTPQAAPRKIAVIEDADRMNVNAANALLKSLEEPPQESFIAMSTSAPERLLPTVRSRCQQIRIRRGGGDEVRNWLGAAGVDLDKAGYWAVEYGGAPFAIASAAERGQVPLWDSLEKAARSPAAARAAGDGLREVDLVDLLERWLRIAHWLARRATDSVHGILEFATEILNVRRAALVNTGLNRGMQLQRLFLLWAELWRHTSIPQIPKARL